MNRSEKTGNAQANVLEGGLKDNDVNNQRVKS